MRPLPTAQSGMPSKEDIGLNAKIRRSAKASKPLMERRRRARINQSLSELKELILHENVPDGQTHRQNKMEKADILEMAVTHMRKLHHNSLSNEIRTDSFEFGFSECVQQVARFLSRSSDLDPTLGSRLLQHLSLFGMSPAARCQSDSSCDESYSSEESTQLSTFRAPRSSDSPHSSESSTSGSSGNESHSHVTPRHVAEERRPAEPNPNFFQNGLLFSDVWRPW